MMRTATIPLSVCVISYNAEHTIGRMLESIADIAQEIIVVDSLSTDNTVIIAQQYGAIVHSIEWQGFTKQKNTALQYCTQPWILCLDCDEVLTPELRNSIVQTVQHGATIGYMLNRKTHYLGKLLYHAWQPDWNLRLVHRNAQPTWQGNSVHEQLTVSTATQRLQGYAEHYSYKNLHDHFTKTLRYAQLAADDYHQRGRKFSLLNALVNPCVAFVRLYILHQGFRDGIRGLIAGFSTFVYTALKYFYLWEQQR